uniref:Uncharacterized protein n=1 Tax=Plectus sambesii TaxID=2011161 RepID=A0A914WHQ6_9BILA
MDAIHNAVEKTKELFTGDSHTTDNDVVKAAELEEDMRHKMVLEQIAADIKVSKAAEKVEKRQHELNRQNIRGNANIGSAAGDCVEELKKQKVINETQRQAFIAGNPGYPEIDTTNRLRLTKQQFEERQDQLSSEMDAEKDVFEAAEKLEKEGHKLNEKIFEGNKNLAKALEELNEAITEKEEKRMIAKERIDEATEHKMTVLKDRQLAQRCQDTMLHETTGAPVDKMVYKRTEIH